MKRLLIPFAPVLLLALCSCINPFLPQGGSDFFYVSRESADMPVWVRGNAQSDVFLIVLHGGPGGSSTVYWDTPPFQQLEKDLRVVYWDQRCSGQATGNPGKTSMNPESMAEDLELLVDTINTLYAPTDIFLVGFSWGGLLGTAFLEDSTRQAKIRGWIEADGAHNWPEGMRLSYDWICAYALDKIASPESSSAEKADWQTTYDWYQANPLAAWNTEIPSAWSTHTSNIWKAYGYVAEDYCQAVKDKLNSSDQGWHTAMNYSPSWSWWTLTPKVWTYDTSALMGKITLPALIVWGIHDGILPMPLAQDAYDRLGTPPANKSIVYLANSAHWVVDEEWRLFYDSVIAFITTYRS